MGNHPHTASHRGERRPVCPSRFRIRRRDYFVHTPSYLRNYLRYLLSDQMVSVSPRADHACCRECTMYLSHLFEFVSQWWQPAYRQQNGSFSYKSEFGHNGAFLGMGTPLSLSHFFYCLLEELDFLICTASRYVFAILGSVFRQCQKPQRGTNPPLAGHHPFYPMAKGV